MENEDFELNGEKYHTLEPVSKYLLVEVIDQDAVRRMRSGLYMASEVGVVESKLRIIKKGPEVKLPLESGDYIELDNMNRLQWVKGPEQEKLGLVLESNIAGYYRKVQ